MSPDGPRPRWNLGDGTGHVGNDVVSSLTVAPGYSAVSYKDGDCKGAEMIYTGDIAYVGDSMDDTISSVRVIKTDTLKPRILRYSNVTNFPPQNDVYALVEPLDLEDIDNPGPVLATINSFPVTVNPPRQFLDRRVSSGQDPGDEPRGRVGIVPVIEKIRQPGVGALLAGNSQGRVRFFAGEAQNMAL
ncbi:hypothetical protein ACFXPS_13845 [Nocardia sp. NPDC059091]|uniref:hypothetical protein n=1 Tax=unclassified Nocardia TaxID=2637762 RepID=UPI0036A6793D